MNDEIYIGVDLSYVKDMIIAKVCGTDVEILTIPPLKYKKGKAPSIVERLNNLWLWMEDMDLESNMVTIEDPYTHMSVKTTKDLSALMGAVVYKCAATNTPVTVVAPSKWRKTVLLSGKAPKQAAIDYISDKYGKVYTEDQSEALCIAEYGKILLTAWEGPKL